MGTSEDLAQLPKEEREALLGARFKNRRRMAWISFGMLVTMVTFVLVGILLGPTTFADGVSKVTPLLGMVSMAFVSVVLAYIGASTVEHKQVKL